MSPSNLPVYLWGAASVTRVVQLERGSGLNLHSVPRPLLPAFHETVKLLTPSVFLWVFEGRAHNFVYLFVCFSASSGLLTSLQGSMFGA